MSKSICIVMSERQAALLSDIIDTYFQPGTPIVECAPEWDPKPGEAAYTADEVLKLGAELRAALEG